MEVLPGVEYIARNSPWVLTAVRVKIHYLAVATRERYGGHRADRRGRVNVFRVDERFLFRHYFEGETVFARLKQYYNNQQYRFEVPPGEFDGLRTFLADHGYLLAVVDDVGGFVVVVRKYTHHPENIFKDSVMQRGDADYNYFLMKDRAAVDRAVRNGATPIERTDLEHPF